MADDRYRFTRDRYQYETDEQYELRMFNQSRRLEVIKKEQSFNLSLIEKGIIRLNHPQRLRWDFLIMLLSVFNCILLPFELAFDFRWSHIMHVVYLFIDICFMIDIIFNFRTTYRNVLTNQEEFKPKNIAINYVKG